MFRFSRLTLGAVAGAMALCGCAPEEELSIDQKAQAPAAPDANLGRQFRMPAQVIAPQQERMICWVPDWTPDKDYFVTKLHAFQGSMGHHIVAMQSDVPRKPGSVFDCTSIAQMVNLRPLVLPDPEGETILPEGMAVRMPKGSTLVMQSHYINYADRDIEVADVATLDFTDSPPKTEVSYLILNDSAVKLAAGSNTRQSTCKVPADLNLLLTTGHMHELGKSMHLDVERANETERLYEVAAWTADMRDRPPLARHGDAGSVLSLSKGDVLRVSCTWDNTSGHEVKFPEEMCTTVSYYYPATAEGIILCDE